MSRRILASGSAKAIVSLAWKAKHTMPLALALQTGMGGIAEDRALQANADGDFPLAPSDMEWQLDVFQAPEDQVKRPASRRAASA